MSPRATTAVPQYDSTTKTWGFVVDLPAGPGGRRRQARRRGYNTKRAAQEALDALRVGARDGSYVAPQRLRVGEYLDSWLAGLSTTGRRPATVASYRRNARLHLLPYLGGVRLQELGPLHLDDLYRRLLEDGNRRGAAGGLSPRTVRYVHTIVRKALDDAVRKGLVVRNVADVASPPSAKSTRAPEMAWWRPEELRAFLDATAGDDLGALWRLAGMTGARRGELLGLPWRLVDFDKGRLTVRHQLGQIEQAAVPCPACGAVHDELVFATVPKTDAGRRTIDLDPATVSVLRAHRARQLEVRLLMGAGFVDHDLVFCGPGGLPLRPSAVSKVFDRRVARLALPRVRFHDLRHTHAAHLIRAGRDPLTISKRLGHASPAFTLSKYGHLFEQADSEAAAAVAALVDGATRAVVTNL